MILKKKKWHCLPGQPITELDKQVMSWEKKGKEVPSRDLIKTPEQIEGIRRSGVVNTGCLDEVAKNIHVGMNTQEIDDICMAYCKEHNAIPACLNYEGYPKSVCTSINEVVCHGIPKVEDVLEEGDIVNVDMTTILDGYYADASRMFIIGKTTPEKEQLVRVAKECLEIGAEAGFIADFVQLVDVITYTLPQCFEYVRWRTPHAYSNETAGRIEMQIITTTLAFPSTGGSNIYSKMCFIGCFVCRKTYIAVDSENTVFYIYILDIIVEN